MADGVKTSLDIVVANLAGQIRRAKYHGRDYIVAPLSLIVTGVLNGSKGALYYPSEEVHRDPAVWNHVPIVVYHPTVNGRPVSARDPDVLERSGIGFVFKSKAKSGKLSAEGWFDVKHTERVDNRILEALERGTPIELSTGLFTDNDPTPGVFNGRNYDFVARNYRPDHLAILPDQTGACSLRDGCGVLIGNGEDIETVYNRDWPQSKREKTPHDDFGGPGMSFPIETQSDVEAAAHLIGHADDPDAVKAKIKAIIKRKGLQLPVSWRSEDDSTQNEAQDDPASSETVSNEGEAMNDAEKKKLVDGLITNCSCQSNNVWSEDDREMLEGMSDEKLVALNKQRTELVANSALVSVVAKEMKLKPSQLTVNAMPAALQAAAKKKKAAAKDEEPDGDESTDSPDDTGKGADYAGNMEQWLKGMPREAQETFAEASNVVAKAKADLIAKIVTNMSDADKAEAIEKFSNEKLDTLRLIANAIPELPKKESTMPVMHRPAHFLGAGAPITNAGSRRAAEIDETPYLAPIINYAEEVAARDAKRA